MFLRRSLSRSLSAPGWFSQTSTAATMPLRAKVTNPAIAGLARMSTASELPRELPGDEPDDVLFNSLYGVRLIELNRPKKLNSLNGSMARKILPRLKEWEKSQLANIVMISGAGTKAFCAGGDVAALALQNEQGEQGQKASSDFFGLEYQLDHVIATYSKPFVAVMDGITMGGGVGLSVHAPFRIATERTLFAMPETTIGFFPDVGGSFFLPRLDGQLGVYLAMTSERLSGVQAYYAGIATHYVDSSVLANLTQRLSELVFNDYASLPDRLKLVNQTMAEFSTGLPSGDEGEIRLAGSLRAAIDRCFGHNTVEDIFKALENETQEETWAKKTLETLSIRSPTSLKVTLRQMRLGTRWSIAETFRREHQIASHFMRHPDFVEGVKARLMSKPPREPKWQPLTLAEVSSKDVDAFFEVPSAAARLSLFGGKDYAAYPHARFALPTEKDVRDLVEAGPKTKKQIIDNFLTQWSHKDGVEKKVSEVLARKAVQSPEGLRWQE